MQRGNWLTSDDFAQLNQIEQDSPRGGRETMTEMASAMYPRACMMDSPLYPICQQDRDLEMSISRNPFSEEGTHLADPAMSVADFVERLFIPGYVMSKRTAGRAHFQGILKHILSPERAARAFRPTGKTRTRLAAVPGWPYLDDLPISEVRPANVEQLIQASVSRGYSSQTATHLRNVIRNILSYAAACGYFTGPNPATFVEAPSIAHKPV